MSETDIKKSIKDYLKLSGWFCFSIMQGLGSYRGISDIIAIKDSYVIFIEVKTETGKQSEYQKQFEKDITENGGHYILARSYKDVDDYIVRWFKVRSLLL